jgi:hypothetical protein
MTNWLLLPQCKNRKIRSPRPVGEGNYWGVEIQSPNFRGTIEGIDEPQTSKPLGILSIFLPFP